jgi:6-phosphogluconolactonase (cycloisomerase 2 family)
MRTNVIPAEAAMKGGTHSCRYAVCLLFLLSIVGPSAVAQTLSFSPPSLNFGSRMVGTRSAAQTVTLTVDAYPSLVITSVAITGANPAAFAIAPGTTCTNGSTVLPHSSCVIKVTFKPGTVGPKSASVTLTDNAPDTPQNIPLTGSGLGAAVQLSPTSLNFGNETVGLSASRSVTLTNTGNLSLSLTTVALTGPNSGVFHIASGTTCTNGSTVQPNSTCVINVTFAPPSTGSKTASVSLTDNSVGGPKSFGLSGTGIAATVALKPGSLKFGSLLLGTSSSAETVVLTNTGSGTLSFTSVGVTGANASSFVLTPSSTCTTGSTLPPGSTCTLVVTFAPKAIGPNSAKVSLVDNSLSGPKSLSLSGTGLGPAVQLSSTVVNFGSQAVDSTNSTQVTLTNAGNVTLSLNSIAITGANASDFFLAPGTTCPTTGGTLGPGANCTIGIGFTPSDNGSRSASVVINDDASGSPHTISLSGSGTAVPAQVSPTDISFGNLVVGNTSGTQTATLINNQTVATLNFTSPIALGGLNPGDFTIANTSTCVFGTPVAANGGTCVVNLAFTPTAPGNRSASVTFTDDATNSPQVVNLTGNGIAKVTVSLQALNLGSQALNTTSLPKSVTLSNDETSAIGISNFSFVGDFALDPTGTTCVLGQATLGAGSSCIVSVTFRPTAIGTRGGLLTIADDAGNQTVTLTGSTPPRFAYATNFNDNTISLYTVNPTTGQLRANGYLFSSQIGPRSVAVAVDPKGQFAYAYVANFKSANVSAYAIDLAGGTLTEVAGSPFATGNFPNSVAVLPSINTNGDVTQEAVYVVNLNSDNVSGYTICLPTPQAVNAPACAVPNPLAPGTLVPMASSPFSTGAGPSGISIDPLGRFAYVPNLLDSSVSAYTIGADGTLTRTTPATFAAGTAPQSVVVDPSGRFVYTANNTSNDVSAFSIVAASGNLTPIPGSPFAAGTGANSLTIDPSGQFVYVADGTAGNISAYTIDPTSGALAQIVNSPFPAGSLPRSVTVDPSGTFVYAPNLNSDNISVFKIDPASGDLLSLGQMIARAGSSSFAFAAGATAVAYKPLLAYSANLYGNSVSAFTIDPTSGGLTAVSGSPFPTGATPQSVTADPSGKFAYVASGGSSNNLAAYAINADGSLKALSGSPFSAGTVPHSVVVDPSGRFVYVANQNSGGISAYTLNPDGSLASIAGASAGTGPASLTIDPSGRFLYAANGTSNNISAFSIDPTSGALTAVTNSPFAAGKSPNSVAVDPTGTFAFVTDGQDSNVTAYTLNPVTGALTQVPGSPFPAGTAPRSVTVEPSGKYVYTANFGSDNFSAFAIDPTTGILNPLASSPFPGASQPDSIAVDPSGNFVYVANIGSNNISVYSLDPTTGNLSPTTPSSFPTDTGPISLAIIGKVH